MRQVGALLAGSMGLVSIAHSGAPLSTDDVGVLEPTACESETYAQHLHVAGIVSVRALSTQFGCGIGARSQIGFGYARAASGGAHDDAIGLSGKTGLFSADAASAAPFDLALAWRLTALRVAGTGFRHEGTAVVLVASRPLGAGFTAHANLGWSRSEASRASSTTWNVAAEAVVASGFELMAEVYGDDRDRPWRGVAARWAPAPHLSFGLSWARQSAHPRSRFASVGVKLGF
ncbi:MAG: hypothetical protein ABIO45_04100 [Burkholderiaceae bacterium]